MKLTFSIEGKAKAKQSVKVGKWGNYTPKDMVEYANWVKLSFRMAYPRHDYHVFENKPLQMVIDTYFEVPKSFSVKKRNMAIGDFIRPTVKPDCDNIAKNIQDALNGIAYPDDKQVVCLVVRKWYAQKSATRITISETVKKD